MEEKKYLTEERYLKSKRKITILSIVILIIGLLVGGSVIGAGAVKYKGVDTQYSNEALDDLNSQLDAEKQILLEKKAELEDKGITYDAFAEYTDGESYTYKVIVDALNPSFPYYEFDECKNNEITEKYCELKNKVENDFDNDFNKNYDIITTIPYFIIGGFIIMVSFGAFVVITVFSKRREIAAFTTQQMMPVAKEGIEEIAPSIGKAAKHITKGIKDGLKDDE